MAGYHKAEITSGEIGEISKIQEELDELKDAVDQGVKILQLVEMSDLVGALQEYLAKHHPGTSMKDLFEMAKLTKKAFTDGTRQTSSKPA